MYGRFSGFSLISGVLGVRAEKRRRVCGVTKTEMSHVSLIRYSPQFIKSYLEEQHQHYAEKHLHYQMELKYEMDQLQQTETF
jgi:hypothetical protein